MQTRRQAIGTLVGAASVTALGGANARAEATAEEAPRVAEAWKVTEATIRELEHLYALPLTNVGRQRLVDSVEGNLRNTLALRAVERSRDLRPALEFDPRLPGKAYRAQPDSVRLAGKPIRAMPRDPAAIACASLVEQGHWLRSGQLTSARLTDIYLERIARIDKKLRSFITVTADLAREQAAAADRELAQGKDRGPLHGLPYGVKDLLDTAGIRTTWGAEPFRDRVPTEDAAIVTRLREAGSPLLGKLSTGALGHGHVWLGIKTRNPWNIEETSGGSSAGSGSATAAGLVSYSIGTDGGGSIINPADRCGVVGLRPTFGRVPRTGGMPMTPNFSRAGPLTRTVEDAVLVLAAINRPGVELRDASALGFTYDASLDLSQLRVGVVLGLRESANALDRRVLALLSELGVTVKDVELPRLPYGALSLLMSVESAAFFEDLTLSNVDETLEFGDLNPGQPQVWRRARLYSAVDYVQADRIRRLAMQEFHDLFEKVDMLCGPTYGPFGAVGATSLTGHPGLTLRVGFEQSPTRGIGGDPVDAKGTPRRITRNFTLHGPLFEEGKMLSVARALEDRLDVWRERPPVD